MSEVHQSCKCQDTYTLYVAVQCHCWDLPEGPKWWDKVLHYSGFTSPGITAGGGEEQYRSQGHRTEWLQHKWQLGQTGVLTNTPCTM